MSSQDVIADMLTRIRNAQMANHQSVSVPGSKLKLALASVLKEEGYVDSYKEVVEGAKKTLVIELKYYMGKPVIEMIKRVSKPSLRIYKNKDELPRVKDGLGIAILSTSRGVMVDKKARELGCGGEILCIVA